MIEDVLFNTNYLFSIFMSAGLGAFIGLEREMPRTNISEDYKYDNFGGLRTYSILAVIGAICVWFDLFLGYYIFSIIGFLSVVLFILINYSFSVYKKGNFGLTSEYSAILTYLVGVLTMLGNIKFALIITIFLTVLLSLKEFQEKIVKRIERKELINTLKFAVVSLVILPLLPNEKYSFGEIFSNLGFEESIDIQNSIWQMQFFNPYSVWFFVVAISAIGYIGYILSKLIGKHSSVVISGIVGGLVSSTAVTATMSEQSKKDKGSTNIYIIGTLAANLIMIVRVYIIVALFNFTLLRYFSIPFIFLFLGLFFEFLYFYSKHQKNRKEIAGVDQKIESPFSIIPALKFGLFVLFIKFLAGIGILYKDIFGEGIYYYILGIISGFADVDAITQTMAVDSSFGGIIPTIAVATIVLAVMSNNIVKGTIALKFGEKNFGRKIMFSFVVSVITGIMGILLVNFILI